MLPLEVGDGVSNLLQFSQRWPLGADSHLARGASAEASAGHGGVLLFAGFMALACFVPLVMMTGSRTGLILAPLAVLSAIFVVPQATARAILPFGLQRRTVFVASLAAFLVFVAVAAWLGRDLALARLLSSTPGEGLRMQILPTLWQMAADHWFWGTGLGTFENVYQIYEPSALLMSAYVNHAHNDWLEIIITGGLPALILLIGSAILVILKASQFRKTNGCDWMQPLRVASFFCIGLLSLASITDYPLRTPYLAGLFTLCIVWFFTPVRGGGLSARDNFRQEHTR